MRQWRVGSFSMGLLLVLLGVGLLLDRFKGGVSALEVIINWWPVILILLGIEVLAVGFLSRSETFKMKYDFWSILLVAIFFFFSLSAYAVHSSGLIPFVQEALGATEQAVNLPVQVIPLEGVNRVVLSFTDGNFELRSSGEDSLQIFGQMRVFASGAEAARLAGEDGATYHVSGGTLFVQANQVPYRAGPFGTGVRQINRKVLVPATMDLEVQCSRFGSYGESQVVLEALEASWSLDLNSGVTVFLSPGLDVTVHGSTESPGGFSGNAAWELPPGQSPETAASGMIKLGTGSRLLNIRSQWEIKVNIR